MSNNLHYSKIHTVPLGITWLIDDTQFNYFTDADIALRYGKDCQYKQ
jgi:hypothetical protein